MLFAQSGGFCHVDRCEMSVLEHHVTKAKENHSNQAHIVAYKEGGPRGDPSVDGTYINSIENLMLLCPGCHSHVDKNARQYPRRALELMKHGRVELVRRAIQTRASELRTYALVFEAPIGSRSVSIADHQIVAAISPRHLGHSIPLRIQTNQLAAVGEVDSFYAVAAEMIEKRVKAFWETGGDLARAEHVSVFAFGPIPLLVKLGASLNDKVPHHIHNLRNDPSTWEWNSSGEAARYSFRVVKQGTKDAEPILAISISGAFSLGSVDPALAESATVYELVLDDRPIGRTAIQRSEDIDSFRSAYSNALAEIAKRHGASTPVHLMAAVPVGPSVAFGLMRHPKVHGPLKVYDYRDGNFKPTRDMV